MKVSEFKTTYEKKAQDILSGGLESIANFLRHKTKDDKQFRDELTAIYSFLISTNSPESDDIVIGGEIENFDAQVGATILEVVRALPEGSHVIRGQVANGSVPSSTENAANACSAETLAALVTCALKKKQRKHYSDTRTLLISVDGEDTQEYDALVLLAIETIRKTETKEPFSAVWLVESGRRKAFRIFPPDA